MRWFGRTGVVCAVLAGAGVVGYHSDFLDHPWWSSWGVVRFGRASSAAFLVGVDYKWSMRHHKEGDDLSEIHLRSALRLRDMCSRNGGLFIKVGQHIGALEYLLPREYVDTFKIFHSEAPKTPFKRLMTVIEEDLGKPVEEIFCEVSEDPLGAASLAQVHRAKLSSNGSEVAVKIQHPDVRKNGYTDMETIDFLVSCVHWVFPSFHFQWLADEIRRNLPIELNFLCEAKNQDKFSSMFKHLSFIKAPKVHWELSTSRVLTMEFCQGVKVNDKAYLERNHISADEVMLKLGKLYSEMIFQRGFVHCDPHPGNILIRCCEGKKKDLEIILLDHGLYSELSDDFRMNYCRLWQALISDDQKAIRRSCEELQAGSLYRLLACMVTARAWANIESGITNSNRSHREMEDIQKKLPHFLPEITQLLDNVPRQLVLILKTNDLLRSIEHSLGASAYRSSYLTMAKSCLHALGDHQVATTQSWSGKLYWRLKISWNLLTVHTYEFWLRLQALFRH